MFPQAAPSDALRVCFSGGDLEACEPIGQRGEANFRPLPSTAPGIGAESHNASPPGVTGLTWPDSVGGTHITTAAIATRNHGLAVCDFWHVNRLGSRRDLERPYVLFFGVVNHERFSFKRVFVI